MLVQKVAKTVKSAWVAENVVVSVEPLLHRCQPENEELGLNLSRSADLSLRPSTAKLAVKPYSGRHTCRLISMQYSSLS